MCKNANMLVKKCGAKVKFPIFAGRFEKQKTINLL